MTTYTATASEIALPTATDLTVMQLVSVTRSIVLTEWSVSFDGVTIADAPVTVSLYRQATTASSGSSVTPSKRLAYASDATTVVWSDPSSEPTLGELMETYYVTPAGGIVVMQYQEGAEIVSVDTERIGLVVNAPDGAVNANVWMGWSEA